MASIDSGIGRCAPGVTKSSSNVSILEPRFLSWCRPWCYVHGSFISARSISGRRGFFSSGCVASWSMFHKFASSASSIPRHPHQQIHLIALRHPREGGDPCCDRSTSKWIPAFAGMTTHINLSSHVSKLLLLLEFQVPRNTEMQLHPTPKTVGEKASPRLRGDPTLIASALSALERAGVRAASSRLA